MPTNYPGSVDAFLLLADNISQASASQMNNAQDAITALERYGLPVYNVKTYGGAKGDGVTDDTTAIQNTINAASSAGGSKVFVPPGTYMCRPLNLATGVEFWGAGQGTVLKMVANGPNDNLFKMQSVTDIVGGNFVLDGNKANQTQTQYGFYSGGCRRIRFQNVWTQNWRGVGFHVYNNDDSAFAACYSTLNNYHGFEVEQCRYCSFQACYGYSNTLHGLLVSPGEVSGSGSFGNKFSGCHFHDNTQYGIGFNAGNGDVSHHLGEGNEFVNCSAYNNGQYGVQIFKQSRQIFSNLYVYNNGYFGIYLYQSAFNQFSNVFLHNNSQVTNAGYDEILQEGSAGGYASARNIWNGVAITIDGATKARWAINESTAGDGPNFYSNISVINAGTSGRLNILTQLAAADAYGQAFLPTVAGTPTGVPAAGAGIAPMVYDTTGKKLWVYDTVTSTWKGVVVA